MAPACLNDPGVTIVVVPYRALVNNLVTTATKARIDYIEYEPGEQDPAALVFVSADFVAEGQFLSYAQLSSMLQIFEVPILGQLRFRATSPKQCLSSRLNFSFQR